MENKKRQGIIELITGIVGIAVLFALQNEWSYIPIVLYGILSVVMIRKNIEQLTDEEIKCIKKRNIVSIIALVAFLIICYFSVSDTLRDNLLWILLSVYLFLAAHGIVFIAPINTFPNEKK